MTLNFEVFQSSVFRLLSVIFFYLHILSRVMVLSTFSMMLTLKIKFPTPTSTLNFRIKNPLLTDFISVYGNSFSTCSRWTLCSHYWQLSLSCPDPIHQQIMVALLSLPILNQIHLTVLLLSLVQISVISCLPGYNSLLTCLFAPSLSSSMYFQWSTQNDLITCNSNHLLLCFKHSSSFLSLSIWKSKSFSGPIRPPWFFPPLTSLTPPPPTSTFTCNLSNCFQRSN